MFFWAVRVQEEELVLRTQVGGSAESVVGMEVEGKMNCCLKQEEQEILCVLGLAKYIFEFLAGTPPKA